MTTVFKVSPVLVERARQEVRELTTARKPVPEALRRVAQVHLVSDPETSGPRRPAARDR